MLRFMSLLHVRHIELERLTLLESESFSELLDPFSKFGIPFLTRLNATHREAHVLAGRHSSDVDLARVGGAGVVLKADRDIAWLQIGRVHNESEVVLDF